MEMTSKTHKAVKEMNDILNKVDSFVLSYLDAKNGVAVGLNCDKFIYAYDVFTDKYRMFFTESVDRICKIFPIADCIMSFDANVEEGLVFEREFLDEDDEEEENDNPNSMNEKRFRLIKEKDRNFCIHFVLLDDEKNGRENGKAAYGAKKCAKASVVDPFKMEESGNSGVRKLF